MARSLVCNSGSGIWTLQRCLISSFLMICLSFVSKSMHTWGSEFLPLYIQLIQDWAAQCQVSGHLPLWSGLPLLWLVALAHEDRSPRHTVSQSQVCIFLFLCPDPPLSATGFRIPALIFFMCEFGSFFGIYLPQDLCTKHISQQQGTNFPFSQSHLGWS